MNHQILFDINTESAALFRIYFANPCLSLLMAPSSVAHCRSSILCSSIAETDSCFAVHFSGSWFPVTYIFSAVLFLLPSCPFHPLLSSCPFFSLFSDFLIDKFAVSLCGCRFVCVLGERTRSRKKREEVSRNGQTLSGNAMTKEGSL